MPRLTLLCVTKGLPEAVPFLERIAGDAELLGAECVVLLDKAYGQTPELPENVEVVEVVSDGYLESVLDRGVSVCTGEYILRIDDDESISDAMMEWLDQERYLEADHWKFPRAWLWKDEQHFLQMAPFWPDEQTRLSVKAKAGGRRTIHSGSPHGGGQSAGPNIAIVHHKFLVNDKEQRERLVKHYDSIQNGAGSAFRGFYVPEDFDRLTIGEWPVDFITGEVREEVRPDAAPAPPQALVTAQLSGFPMAQHGEEIEAFVEWLLNRPGGAPKTVVEIGTQHGGTAVLWSQLAEKVITVDLPDGPYGGLSRSDAEKRNNKLEAIYPNVLGVLGSSHDPEIVEFVRESLEGGQIDMLFIDGDHHYEGVKKDFEMYLPMVAPGGVIAFHDIVDTPLTRGLDVGVNRFWHELMEKYECFEININADWGGIGILIV